MDNWRKATVDDIKDSSPNALATGPFGSSISAKFFQKFGVPVIRGSNLSENISQRLIHDDLVFVTEEKARQFKRSIARKGDLIFTCWGTIGQVGLIDDRCHYNEYVVSNKQMKLTPDPQKADSLFLYYLFSGPNVSGQIKSQSIGSSVPGFNLGQLRSIPFDLPPLPEQHAIAHFLGALDDKIELNRRMNRTLEAMAQAIFKSWFVDFDPVAAKAEGRQPYGMSEEMAGLFPDGFHNLESGPLPDGWELVPLPELLDVNPSRKLQNGHIAPYLEMANMPTVIHIPETWIERAAGSGMRFINGDTLVARITPCLENGKTAYVDFLEEEQVGWGSTEYIVLRPKPPIPTIYAYCLARTNDFREFAIQAMTGSSGRQRVPAESLKFYKLTKPSVPVTVAFGKIVNPLFVRVRQNMKETKNLTAIRDTLLPKLLSGEIRVGQAERAVEQAT